MVSYITYTVEIGGISRKYKKIPQYERQLKTNTVTSITLTVEYDTENPINFWDAIEIKKNGVSEWKGFVEGKNITWDKDGIYYEITGRDNSVILWKKFNENFSNMHEGTNGFFGRVDSSELIKFFLRCPKSDPVSQYPNNKSGWGIDVSKISSVKAYYADAEMKSFGDPEWIFARKRGLGWKNGGELEHVDLAVNTVGTMQWTPHGSSPYLNDEDDINYIQSDCVFDEYATFRLDNLPANATSLKSVSLSIAFKPDTAWWGWTFWGEILSRCYVYLSKDGGSNWSYIGEFGGRMNPLVAYPWWHRIFSIPVDFFSSISELQNNNLWVKFVEKTAALGLSAGLSTKITEAHLSVIYEEQGKQAVGDEIDIILKESETLSGIYVESRADTLPESYPRNYGFVKVTDNQQNYTTYIETDPNNHISETTTHIDFNAFQNEDAYLYKDMIASPVGPYFDHFFNVKMSSMDEDRQVGIWAVSSVVDDYYGLLTNGNNIAMAIQRPLGYSVPIFTLRNVYTGVVQDIVSSKDVVLGENYFVYVKRIGDVVRAYIYDSNGLFDMLEIVLTNELLTYRYIFACLSSNRSMSGNTDVDLDMLTTQSYNSLGWKNNNICRDVIHSWTPQEMSHIRMRITDQADFSWGITQIYLYAADEVDYRVWYEGGTLPSFNLNQYIQEVLFDSTYSTPIGPLNVPEGRLLDTIYDLVKILNENYIPYDVWMEGNSNNTLHIKNRRGSDKSATVNFQLALNLEENSYSKSVENTVQRLKISGSGEGKENDETSSDWVTSIPAEIYSFYEDIISRKNVSDYSMAMILAQIALLEQKNPKEQIRFKVSKDDYLPMTYDVGDTVTVTDSLVGLAVATKIYNISKSVDADSGEEIIITCGAPYEDVEEIWKDIYARLKTLERVGVVKPDWTADSVENAKIDPNKLDTIFEATGHSDEESTGEKQDAQWWYSYSNRPAGARGPDIFNMSGTGVWDWVTAPDHGMDFNIRGSNGVIKGPNDENTPHYLMAERRYDDVDDGQDEFHDIPISSNPKMEFELKIFETYGSIPPPPSPQFWNAGDTLDVGFKKWGDDPSNPLNGTGYWFRILALGDSQFEIYAMWTGCVPKLIMSATANKRYRFEIIADKDRRQVFFNVYDVDLSADFPYSAVRMNADINEVVRPFHVCIVANHNGEYVAQAYFYRLKIEYQRVGG